jgi:hypothetical protein
MYLGSLFVKRGKDMNGNNFVVFHNGARKIEMKETRACRYTVDI